MVGRHHELSQLLQVQARLNAGQGSVVSVVAEAGLGKSRLINEVQHKGRDLGDLTRWAEGRALSHAQNASYLVIRHALRDLLGLDIEAAPAEVEQALRVEVEQLFPDTSAEIYPYLAYLMDLPLNEPETQRVKYLEGEALRQRIWLAGQDLIKHKSLAQPLVLVCDDLHWADPSSLEVLQALMPLTTQCRLLLILVYRPRRDRGIWQFHEQISHQLGEAYACIELPPLSPADSRQLLQNLLGRCSLPAELQALILRKSEGNPFYLEEVIRSLLNSGALVRHDDGDCTVTAGINDIAIPDTLQGVIMSRIDQLDPAAKRLLQVASVIGRDFMGQTLRAVSPDTLDVAQHFTQLQRQDLISRKEESADEEYAFKHVFTQESIYNSLLRTDRRQLHQNVGEAIEQTWAGKLEEQALILAHHFEQSQDGGRAIKYLGQAADRARRTFANQEAKDLYSRVLALLGKEDYALRWETLAAREQTCDRLGERDQQATDLTLMQTLAELLGNDEYLALTHNRRAAYFDKISEYQASDEAAAAGLRVAQRANNPRLEAQSLNSLALTAWRRFDYREVQKWANQALEALKIVGAPAIRITSLLHLGRASYRLGQYDNALNYIQGAQSIAEDLDNREQEALSELILGWIYQRLGRYDQSAEHYEKMLTIRRMIGDRHGEATALSHLGWLATDQKLFQQGLDYCQPALQISQSVNDRENEAYALSGLALNYEQLGQFELATINYEKALAIHRDIGASTLVIFDQAGLARLALAQQDLAAAQGHITPVADWIAAGKAQQFWDPWTIYYSAYQILAAVGAQAEAQAIVAEAHTLLQQRASEISDPVLRECFLEQVEVNRKIGVAWHALQLDAGA
jgi:tetratricopeptide (TPR) repeat protein